MKNDFFHQHLLKLGLIVSSCLVGPPLAASELSSKEKQHKGELDAIAQGLYRESKSVDWSKEQVSKNADPKLNKASVIDEQALFSPEAQRAYISTLPSDNLLAANGSTDQIADEDEQRAILVNFNNISMVEYIRFISRNTNKNFIFDESELQFNITLISEELTSIDDIMTALIQELRIHDLTLLEQGNNFIIHRNPKVNAISNLVSGEVEVPPTSEIVTQVFKLNTADAEKIATIVRPLASDYAIVEHVKETNHLIVTDLSSNVAQIAKLIKSLDSPASGLVIGQYVVRTTSTEGLIAMAQKIIAPIAQDQTLIMVPWNVSNSIFVVSSPFIVERALSILQHIDQNQKTTKIFDFKQLKYQDTAPSDLPSAGLYINSIPYELTPEEQLREEQIIEQQERERNTRRVPQTGWVRTPQGRWRFQFSQNLDQPATEPPRGIWKIDNQGKWYFDVSADQGPGGAFPGISPAGSWKKDAQGQWYFDVTAPQAAPGAGAGAPGAPGGFGSAGGVGVPGVQRGPGSPGIPGSPSFPGAAGTAGPAGAFGVPGEPLGIPLGTGEWMDEDQVRQGFSGASFPLKPPKGVWRYDPTEGWQYELERGEAISVERLTRFQPVSPAIPLGSKEKSSFSIYKLQYRKGDAIQAALQAIAASLMSIPTHSEPLIATLTSVQWLETSNSLIFTGFKDDLLKMRQFMAEIDVPLRQVFIEMLVLETSIADALQYSVSWGSRFGGGDVAGAQGFNPVAPVPSPLSSVLDQTGQSIGGLQPGGLATTPTAGLAGLGANGALNPAGQSIGGLQPAGLSSGGFSYGIVGQSIVNTALGLEFNSLGALFQAVRTKNNINVIINPKILTEDSVPAEIFVGENIPFKTQSIASGDLNQTITNNFEYRDIGTRLRITPTLGNSDIITLEIVQEMSSISAIQLDISSGANSNNSPGPATTKSTTTTRVHLPDGYFLIISGMMRDQVDHITTQVPCLGALPVVGSFLGKSKEYRDQKRNQMIFIRPKIVQLREEIENLTKHNQDIWNAKHEFKQDWLYESERALDFLNLKRSDIVETHPEFADYHN